MLQHCIPLPGVHSYSTTKQSTLAHIKAMPELQNMPCITMEQIHHNRFAHLNTLPTTDISVKGVDAVLTHFPGVALAVKHADCLPILIYHPTGLIGAVHAGRRSTQQMLLTQVLRYIHSQLGLLGSLHLWFGPALCEECHTFKQGEATHFDLLAENTRQAHSIYQPDALRISYAQRCTKHEPEMFFSYRAHGPGVPMNWSVVAY